MLKRRPLPGRPKEKPPTKKASAVAAAESTDPTLARPAMKVPQILAELEEACKFIGIRLTYEALGGELGSGGLCKVKGKWRAIYDKRTTPAERVTLLVPLLARFNLDGAPLSEAVRELILRMQRPAAEPAAEAHAS